MSFYCISVLGGYEEKYERELNESLKKENLKDSKVYLFKKKMKLKNGKEYEDLFFPGYVFLETEVNDLKVLKKVSSGCKGFIRILPSNKNISALNQPDLEIVKSILRFGETIDFVPVTFDEGDKIVILGGPLKNIPATVVSVNRRNKRVNVQLNFLNGVSVFGLTYQEIKKVEEE